MAISRCLLIGAAFGTCLAFVSHAAASHPAKPARPAAVMASL